MRPISARAGCLAQCGWKGGLAKFQPSWTILADSMCVARWTLTQNCSRGSCLTHPQAMNKHRTSSYATVSCRGLVRGPVVHVLACLADPVCFYGQGQTGPNTDFSSKNPKIGSRIWAGMGLESGWAHALGCPEWGPPGAGPQEGVLGTWWWCTCRSGPIPAIPAHTDVYLQIHAIPAHT